MKPILQSTSARVEGAIERTSKCILQERDSAQRKPPARIHHLLDEKERRQRARMFGRRETENFSSQEPIPMGETVIASIHPNMIDRRRISTSLTGPWVAPQTPWS
jgi:hypothetical protein